MGLFGKTRSVEKDDEPKTPVYDTFEIHAKDNIETRAANIVRMIGFRGGSGGFSIPQISPQDATLRVLQVLRKYEEIDHA